MAMTSSPLILALDVSSQEEALGWVKRLGSKIGVYKVGMQLFYRYGPQIVEAIAAEGGAVFLDLKLHDIPNTVAHTCESLTHLPIRFLTVHTTGGREMLKAAQQVFEGTPTQLLGVTALTSLDQEALQTVFPGLAKTPEAWCVHLAGLAQEAGIPGIVCSAHENAPIRTQLGHRLCLVNPGIRPSGADVQDQKRVVTPGEAIRSGANYLVVGRPILQASEPERVVSGMLEEISNAVGLPS